MRILQLISSSGLYGAERVVLELSCFLKQTEGVEVQVGAVTTRGSETPAVIEEAARLGIAVEVFPSTGALDPGLPLRLALHMRAQRMDLLHTHNYKVDVNGYLACRLGARETTPMATCHNWLTEGLKLRAYEALDKALLRRFPFVVAVSDQVLQELRRVGVQQSRCARVDNGMLVEPRGDAAARSQARRALGLPEGGLVAVTVGRMDKFKAHHQQLRALDQLRRGGLDLRLVLVGEGEEEGNLRALCAELELEQSVLFTGYLPNIRPALEAADLFLLSSKDEGLPMVLLEAMGAGLAVVSTSVGGVPGALGEAGVLVPPERPAALADAVDRLARAPAERADLGRAARLRYEQRYSREVMGQRYLEIYRRLLR